MVAKNGCWMLDVGPAGRVSSGEIIGLNNVGVECAAVHADQFWLRPLDRAREPLVAGPDGPDDGMQQFGAPAAARFGGRRICLRYPRAFSGERDASRLPPAQGRQSRRSAG